MGPRGVVGVQTDVHDLGQAVRTDGQGRGTPLCVQDANGPTASGAHRVSKIAQRRSGQNEVRGARVPRRIQGEATLSPYSSYEPDMFNDLEVPARSVAK